MGESLGMHYNSNYSLPDLWALLSSFVRKIKIKLDFYRPYFSSEVCHCEMHKEETLD